MSKLKIGDKVVTPFGIGTLIEELEDLGYQFSIVQFGNSKGSNYNFELQIRKKDLKPYKSPQERLFDLGFEKVAKHKFVKVNKGGTGYNTPYKITIEFAFNMYQVKCECENWVGVDYELSKILTEYLAEM